jgi:glycosyltransferase involved in cell wall biosynthesis
MLRCDGPSAGSNKVSVADAPHGVAVRERFRARGLGLGDASVMIWPMAVSVVIPVFNAETTLCPLVQALAAIPELQPMELILVNDASRDRSWEVIRQLAAEHDWIRGFNLSRNYGQHNALLCGIRAATGQIVITMDDDLQNPPEELPRMLAKLREGYDVVYGTPQTENHGFLRNMASRMTKIALQSTMGANTAGSVSAFRVFRAHLRNSFEHYNGPYVSIDVLLTWGTESFTAIPVLNRPRTIGVSNYTVGKLILHAMNMVTGFSSLPLQFASVLGFALTIFGALVLLYVVLRYLIQGTSMPGFPFLASIISIFSGAQLFALGILGEYIARMHSRSMDKPSYAIRARTEE